MFLLRLLVVGLVGALFACSGEAQKTQEPITADVDDEDSENDGLAEERDQVEGVEEPTVGESVDNVAGTAADRTEGGEFWLVDAPKLNVRRGPGSNFAVSRTLKKGEQVQPIECENNWCKIGTDEYVAQKFLSR